MPGPAARGAAHIRRLGAPTTSSLETRQIPGPRINGWLIRQAGHDRFGSGPTTCAAKTGEGIAHRAYGACPDRGNSTGNDIMSSNLDRYKTDLNKLIKLGETMEADLTVRAIEKEGKINEMLKELKKHVTGSFEKNYQNWYTEAHALIRQIIPDRAQEFEGIYRGGSKRRDINATTFSIQDWLAGVCALARIIVERGISMTSQ